MAETILIIDDEPAAENLAALLRAHGYQTLRADTAHDGLRAVNARQTDLVLLEAQLPDMEGWQLCRRLRDVSDLPLILVSSRADARDIVRGFEAGADDYVAKPYDGAVLLARIRRCLLRSPRQRLDEELAFNRGKLRINFISREVRISGKSKHLTPKEFNLLAVLARNAGRALTREELVTQAWGEQYQDATDSLKLYIHYLRKKLERDPQQPEYILTLRGVGYRFMRP